MDRGVSASWGAMVAVISVRDLSKKHRPPLPSELLASFVVYGLLGLLGGPAPQVARITGWGLVLAVLLADSDNILAPVGDFMEGKIGATRQGTLATPGATGGLGGSNLLPGTGTAKGPGNVGKLNPPPSSGGANTF